MAIYRLGYYSVELYESSRVKYDPFEYVVYCTVYMCCSFTALFCSLAAPRYTTAIAIETYCVVLPAQPEPGFVYNFFPSPMADKLVSNVDHSSSAH